MNINRRLFLGLAVTALVACATTKSARPEQPPTILEVENQSVLDMNIYVFRGSERIRVVGSLTIDQSIDLDSSRPSRASSSRHGQHQLSRNGGPGRDRAVERKGHGPATCARLDGYDGMGASGRYGRLSQKELLGPVNVKRSAFVCALLAHSLKSTSCPPAQSF